MLLEFRQIFSSLTLGKENKLLSLTNRKKMSPRRKVRSLRVISLRGLRDFIRDVVSNVSKRIVYLEEEEEQRESASGDWRKRVLKEFIEEFGEFVMGSIPGNLVEPALDEVKNAFAFANARLTLLQNRHG